MPSRRREESKLLNYITDLTWSRFPVESVQWTDATRNYEVCYELVRLMSIQNLTKKNVLETRVMFKVSSDD